MIPPFTSTKVNLIFDRVFLHQLNHKYCLNHIHFNSCEECLVDNETGGLIILKPFNDLQKQTKHQD